MFPFTLLHLFDSMFIDYEEPIVQTPFLMDPHYTPLMRKEIPMNSRYDQRRNQLNEDEEAK